MKERTISHRLGAVMIFCGVLLFALWHFGYVDSIAARIGLDGLGYVMLMKAAVGFVYGVIVGFVRYKTKNAYASMLLHGIMNVFGR